MTSMPTYIYSPNDAQRAQEAVSCAARKVNKCEHRLHTCRSNSDRREASRALKSAQRQLATAEDALALAESRRPACYEVI